MPNCLSCSSPVPADSRYCPRCGSAISPASEMPTTLIPTALSSSSGSLDEGRFTAGTVLAGRYRIIGLLGRGGMGEVYRADDLTLSQPVAMKFLPVGLAQDPVRLSRFIAEVRIARTISHPNVCRVYDIGELEGYRFLSMEFIDGEDLSSLLRRIGRFSADKATEIARQVCAGLAAAHERGVIHRDLKPANIMIDGRGKVRITDFGLAGLASESATSEVRVGTPAYMAPEQLAGREVTIRSDLYALGLILYEMYTGKAAFRRGSSFAELIRDREESVPASPSTLVGDLEPAIERAILRCLEKDPRQRPATALAVAASLPGGDPLAAALAAGETPAPEVVAAAGEEGILAARTGRICVAGTLLCLALAFWLGPSRNLLGKVKLDKSPAVLQDRAQEILKSVGHASPAADTDRGFSADGDYLKYVKEHDTSMQRWDGLARGRPPAVYFWYRQSPRPMVGRPGMTRVTQSDPPQTISGMATVLLDPTGRLLRLEIEPAQVDDAGADGAPPTPTAAAAPAEADWSPIFRDAGLDLAQFTPAVPTWIPPAYSDARSAWEGELPDSSGTKIRVEAASLHGRPTYFRILGPWDRPERMKPTELTTGQRFGQNFAIALILSGMVGSMVMVRRNIKHGRGDQCGAFRIAAAFVIVHLLVWGLWVHHVAAFQDEWGIFFMDTGYTLCWAGLLWLLYIALEPIVRRRWPDTLISWTRLLSGRFRDPLVGRDILVGGLAASAFLALSSVLDVPRLLGIPPPVPNSPSLAYLHHPRFPVGQLFDAPIHSVINGMFVVFLILFLRILLRKQWLALGAFVLLLTVPTALGADNPLVAVPFSLILASMIAFIVLRFGLLAAVSAFTFLTLFGGLVTTLDFSSWSSGPTLVAMAALLALTLYGFAISLGGRPIFGEGLMMEEAN